MEHKLRVTFRGRDDSDHYINKKVTQHGLRLKTTSSWSSDLFPLWDRNRLSIPTDTIVQNYFWPFTQNKNNTFSVGITRQSTSASLTIAASSPHKGNLSLNF